MEIPENHPFIDTSPDSALSDEIVAQRLNAQAQPRRQRGPGKKAMQKTATEVSLVLTKAELQQAAIPSDDTEAILRSQQGVGAEALHGDHLGLGATGDGPELTVEEIEAIKRRSALRARRHMTGAGH